MHQTRWRNWLAEYWVPIAAVAAAVLGVVVGALIVDMPSPPRVYVIHFDGPLTVRLEK